MKRYRSLMLCMVFLVPTVAYADLWVAPECDACTLGMPEPDALTQKALDNYGKREPGKETPVSFNVRDEVTICDRCNCATYTVTTDHKYVGKTYVPITWGRPEPFNAAVCHPTS